MSQNAAEGVSQIACALRRRTDTSPRHKPVRTYERRAAARYPKCLRDTAFRITDPGAHTTDFEFQAAKFTGGACCGLLPIAALRTHE